MQDMNETTALSRGISQCLRSGILPGGLRRQNWALGDVTKYRKDWGGWSGQESPKEMRMEQAY